MKPGIYDHINNADYHGGVGISKSGLDLIHRSPLHFKAARDAANDNAPTAAQRIGTAFHSLLLEPLTFTREYTLALRQQDVPEAIDDRDQLVAMVNELNSGRKAKLPTSGAKADLVARIMAEIATGDEAKDAAISLDLDSMKGAELKAMIDDLNQDRDGLLPTSGTRHELAATLRANGRQVTLWSDVREEWLTNNGHRVVLTADEWDQLHRMRDSVMAHPAASALLTGAPGMAELSVYWNDEDTGELCRCRPDFWRMDGILVDVKTTDDASPEGFAKSIANWRYHVQHPYYLDGINVALQQMGKPTFKHPTSAKSFVFLAVEKKPPHAVAVYMLDAASAQAGREEYRTDLNVYAHCLSSGTWPGYGDKVQQIALPDWKLRRSLEAVAA